ncbi:MAG: hypothetical protein GKS00_21770 [Alphaproteobacteria bacterium]|nr:hypothetical protein [Alphaproteobacteria bacterium]
MIYTVELNFSDSARTDEWNAWYETYLMKLVSLPGLNTAQRYHLVEPGTAHWEYLALYSIESLAVYKTEAYRNIGGGGNASLAYKGLITRRRNVYEGIERMPEITDPGRILFCEDAPFGFDVPNAPFVPLVAGAGRQKAGATELDGQPVRRAVAVSDAATVDRLDLTKQEGLAVYAPITKRHE